MIIPVRCFTCAKVIGNKRDQFLNLVKHGYTEGEALDYCGLERFVIFFFKGILYFISPIQNPKQVLLSSNDVNSR